ncbi:helix-turn-helix transcriptional regulator [Epilithonimonas sp. JDS]|uniref:helix-turn-helix domain-containing protein n=1 Tax=Epilithonimonas sp. JDS TaxID=2902797 RepID=UPI001E3F53D5|nr:helix-turn-helix transcriptional regulator [Epilithonimonas sp. JDS]MCD9855039.1 helix-turn-helix transcriptional regulator [Epilithonimonas sp. JDS]
MKPTLIFFIFFSLLIKSQNTRDAESLFAESKALLYKKPKESGVIAQFLLKNSSTDKEKLQALILLTESNLLAGDYNSATEKLFQSLELSKKIGDPKNDIKINSLLNRLCNELEIESSQLYLIKDEMTLIYYDKAIQSYSQSNWKQTIKYLKSSEKQKSNQELMNFYYALSYCNIGKNDSAQYFAKKIRNIEPYYFYTLSKIRFMEKDFSQSNEEINHLKPIESNVQDLWLKGEIYKLAAENYKKSKDWNQYRDYYKLQIALQDSLNSVKESARISFLSKIDHKQDEILEAKSNYQKNIIYLILIAIFAVLIIAYFLNRKLEQKKINVEKALMDSEERLRFINENKIPESGGKIVIPDKTIRFLLEKLELFERNEEYTDSSISLNQLAENLNTNTKYLSEIINTHKNKNFHSYINELRINYIINKLKNNPVYLKYKVSHLAEEAGFSSHSLFSTVFKQVTGNSPASYIKLIIKKESDENA